MLKPILRPYVRRLRRYLAPPEAKRSGGNDTNEDFAYASLNRALASLLAEGRGTLRPNYTWGILQSAHLARALGYERISAIEFGVAGGNGLLALEHAAERVERLFGVGIEVHGFDTARGLPKPEDYRDLPNLYSESGYKMDETKLRARLRRAKLHLGLIADTVPDFLAQHPAPVAFVSIDVDYYSSTMDAFKVFEAGYDRLLPRVHCYFDDIMGFTCSEFTGERLAMADFNHRHAKRKIAPIYGLKYFLPAIHAEAQWAESMYLAHFFDHPKHNDSDGLVKRSEGDWTRLRE